MTFPKGHPLATARPSVEERELYIADHDDHPLVEGRTLLCPKCEQRQDILDFITLNFVQKFAKDLVPILKCRTCRHVFALRPER